jgi:hypothetical protein
MGFKKYQTYQKDAKKYGYETIEQRCDRSQKKRIAKGLRAIKFPQIKDK